MTKYDIGTDNKFGYLNLIYEDRPEGVMAETEDGGGRFTEVTLRPSVTVTWESVKETAHRLHKRASELCFVANSVNFPVRHEPEIEVR